MAGEKPGKKYGLRIITNELLQATLAIRLLYKERARWENELLADPEAAPRLLAGQQLEHNGFKIWLEFLLPDKATAGERRSLAKAPDGRLVKIRVTGGPDHGS